MLQEVIQCIRDTIRGFVRSLWSSYYLIMATVIVAVVPCTLKKKKPSTNPSLVQAILFPPNLLIPNPFQPTPTYVSPQIP